MQGIAGFPKVVVSADGRGVVSHVGARLLADVAQATGLVAFLIPESACET